MALTKKIENVVKIEHFNNNFIKVFNTNGLCTLVNKNDGSYPYPNLWYSDWEDFDEDCYLVRKGIKSTLIRKKNGEFFLKSLFWSYDWKTFDENLYETTLLSNFREKYSVLIRKDTKKPLLDYILFKKYVNFNDKFLLGFREDGLTTLIKKSDDSLVFEDLWLNEEHFINLTDKTYGVVNNDSLDIYNYN